MDWLRQFFDPPLRCERVGHKWWIEQRRGYRYPGKGYRSVADRVTEERTICVRCKDVLSDWVETHRSGIQSLSLPGDEMDRLERDGELWNPSRTFPLPQPTMQETRNDIAG